MSLPYAADAETSLSPSELQVLKQQYQTELASGHITTQTKFNYAWGLVKSKQRTDMSSGVGLLTGKMHATHGSQRHGSRHTDNLCRNIQVRSTKAARVSLLSFAGPLQDGQL